MGEQESDQGQNGRGNRVETTNRLLEAAAAEFVERGHDSARVSDVARRAGVTVGSIYARWPTKTEMMVAALDHMLEQILPEQRIKGLGLEGLPVPDLLQLWAADLLEPSASREIFTQIFGSARNNPEVELRLQEHLNRSFGQLVGLVERAKDEGHADPQLSTTAIALLLQSIGIGIHMVNSGGLNEDCAPSTEDWVAYMKRLIEASAPPPVD